MTVKNLLWFKQKQLGGEFQAYTTNGLTWFVLTGNKVHDTQRAIDSGGAEQEYVDEEIVYPWESFIKQFEPMDDAGRETMQDHLSVIIKAYENKVQTVRDYLRFGG